MDKLPIIKQKKLINKRAFIKLAEKVRKSFEIESKFLDKFKNDQDHSFKQFHFCN